MSKSSDLTEYTVINIITNASHTFKGDDYLYDDDTNLMVVKKIITYCYDDIISPDELYVYSDDSPICFSYEI